jgi:hypothetical protein
MLRIRLDLDNLSAVTSQVNSSTTQEQTIWREQVLTGLASSSHQVESSVHQVYEQVDQRIERVEELLKAQSNQNQMHQPYQIGPRYGARPMNRKRTSAEEIARLQDLQPARSEGVRVRLNQYASTCRPSCRCACHIAKQSSTPAIVDRILGQLFVGYSGFPLLSSTCDAEECEKPQGPRVSLEYWFPLGLFWSQIFRLQIGYRPVFGPQMSLSTLRRVPDSAQSVNFALNGNIEGLKDLFIRGLASPRDVSTTRGYSVLRVSSHCLLELQPLTTYSGRCMGNNTTLANFWFTQEPIQTIGKQARYPKS